jgi:hypothetical protein
LLASVAARRSVQRARRTETGGSPQVPPSVSPLRSGLRRLPKQFFAESSDFEKPSQNAASNQLLGEGLRLPAPRKRMHRIHQDFHSNVAQFFFIAPVFSKSIPFK